MTEPWERSDDYADFDLNFTAPDFEGAQAAGPPLPPSYGAALVLYALAFILGVPGNVAVAWAATGKLRHQLSNIWFLNLAVADLLCCLALPFLALPLARDHHWPLGRFACKLLSSLAVLNMFASVLLLTALSADRCALVTWPGWCQRRRTPVLARGVCAAAWGLAGLLTVPSFVFRTTRADAFSDKETCVLDYGTAGRRAELLAAALRLLCGFLLPVTAMVVCCGLLLARLHAAGHRPPRPAAAALAMAGCFVGCWLPYHAVLLALAAHRPGAAAYARAQAAQPLAVALAYLNSAADPLLYALVGPGLPCAPCARWAPGPAAASPSPPASPAASTAVTEAGL
ncbi:C5a anaphylatoxin chemotactic receptor 1-like [Struthio camelus]|uniref:C5a anaphylatoxin chemotactic receptor 1-like n=1 Tax=Struthio camelus TaxID=8801 RepID=UPI0036041D07